MVGAGIFWRTSAHKRSPVFRRWARHRIPLTTKGLRVTRAAWQAIGGPFAEAEKCRSAERAGKPRTWFAEKLPSGPAAGVAGRDAHTDKRRRCALGVPQGVRDMGHAFEDGRGSRGAGSVRSPCGRYCHHDVEIARHRAWTRRFRPAACLCSRGSDCTTRRGRSCRCAGAWVRRTAGKRVLGEP